MIHFSLPIVPHSAVCGQVLVLQGTDNESFSLYQTPFPGDRALGMAEAEGLGTERLDQRLRMSMPVLPWEPAGLGVISNYLIIDFSIHWLPHWMFL